MPSNGPVVFHVDVVPSRVAYLVSDSSEAGYRQAIQEATSRWGGVSEPILPVSADGQVPAWYVQILTLAPVEALVNIDVSSDLSEQIGGSLGLAVIPVEHLNTGINPGNWTMPTAHLPYGGPTRVLATSERSLWEVTAAGDLSDRYLEQVRGEGLEIHRPTTPDQVARAALTGTSLLETTSRGLQTYRAAGSFPHPVVLWWVGEEDQLGDCLFLWNLRTLSLWGSSRNHMYILPAADVCHWVDFLPTLEGTLWDSSIVPDLVMGSLTVDEPKLDKLARDYGWEASNGESVRSSIGASRRSGKGDSPIRYLTSSRVDVRAWYGVERRYGQYIDVQAFVDETAMAQLRVAQPLGGVTGRALLRVHSSEFSNLPRRPILAKAVLPTGKWAEDAIEFGGIAGSTVTVDLHLPSLEEALRLILDEQVDTWSLSDKGRLAAVLSPIGGQLDAARLYDAVAALTTPRSQTLLRHLEALSHRPHPQLVELAQTWGGRTERRALAPGEQGLAFEGAVRSLELLCEAGWAERGIRLDCQRCRVSSFIPLDRVEGQGKCPGCAAAPQPLEIAGNNLRVRYRLTTFIDRCSNQGVVGHVFAWAALKGRDPHAYMLLGTDVTSRDGRSFEIDLLGIYQGRLLAGEVKTSAEEFTDEQIAKDIAKCLAVSADIYVLAAMDNLDESTRDRASALATSSGLELLLLDRSNLAASETGGH